MTDTIAQFVADLAAAKTGALVNQYRVEIPGLDRPGGAAIRCTNLRAYLEARVGAPLALIGEAPSAHGWQQPRPQHRAGSRIRVPATASR